MNTVVQTHELTKVYRGRAVVDSLNITVPQGCVYGFLGPNGAGKSTTMKMLLSLIHPTSGRVEVLGEPMNVSNRGRLIRNIGSLIEAPAGYGHLTGAENMRIIRETLGLKKSDVERAITLVRLQGQMDKQVKNYSLGMKQRLGIAMALARNPRLLILDEPTNGLDPAGIEEIRTLLIKLAGEGVSVMISSHLLGEVEKMASVVGVIQDGKLIFEGSRTALMNQSNAPVLLRVGDVPRALEVSTEFSPVLEAGEIRYAGLDDEGASSLVASLVDSGVRVYELRRQPQSLEEVFMKFTGRSEQV